MSWQDIASDAIRLVTNAGLKKDVVDLLKEKLTEKISVLENEKSVLQTENVNLKQKTKNFEQQLQGLKPTKIDLEEITVSLLRRLARSGGSTSLERMANELGIPKVVVQHHAHLLESEGMLKMESQNGGQGRYSFSRTECTLTQKGTAYVVENNVL